MHGHTNVKTNMFVRVRSVHFITALYILSHEGSYKTLLLGSTLQQTLISTFLCSKNIGEAKLNAGSFNVL
jgi:hypothetical protein